MVDKPCNHKTCSFSQILVFTQQEEPRGRMITSGSMIRDGGEPDLETSGAISAKVPVFGGAVWAGGLHLSLRVAVWERVGHQDTSWYCHMLHDAW
jgi:hypothetical protein